MFIRILLDLGDKKIKNWFVKESFKMTKPDIRILRFFWYIAHEKN